MARKLWLSLALIPLALFGFANIASGDSGSTDPFERLISDCEGVTLLHRVTENTPWRLDLSAGAYRVDLWTPTSHFDPAGLQIRGFGHDGLYARGFHERGYPTWTTLSGADDGFDQYGKYRSAFAAPGGMVVYWFEGNVPPYYLLEIFAYEGCPEPAIDQRTLPAEAFRFIEPDYADDEAMADEPMADDAAASLPNGDYEPIIASNWEQTDPSPPVSYHAAADLDTGRVSTSTTMWGQDSYLHLFADCRENGDPKLGFWLPYVTFEEDFPQFLDVSWSVDSGPFMSDRLGLELVDTASAVYFEAGFLGLESFVGDSDWWPDVFAGGVLTVRIVYRGVHEDTFDLDLFRDTPVRGNLLNCGSY